MAYFPEETNIAPKTNAEAKRLIGKRVKYLCEENIDKSGRGYIFPRTGTITDVVGKNIEIDGDMIYLSKLVEMVELKQ